MTISTDVERRFSISKSCAGNILYPCLISIFIWVLLMLIKVIHELAKTFMFHNIFPNSTNLLIYLSIFDSICWNTPISQRAIECSVTTTLTLWQLFNFKFKRLATRGTLIKWIEYPSVYFRIRVNKLVSCIITLVGDPLFESDF